MYSNGWPTPADYAEPQRQASVRHMRDELARDVHRTLLAHHPTRTPEALAELAYDHADAMILESKKRQGETK